ncbi:MAG: hypothetical protein A2X85_07250 [Geobacteraceae bacterium GWF2_54_21]|nr:MAG: hypothetical protein A2X85_07250 [Geobacteraceae bacterium GWF2_54_21]
MKIDQNIHNMAVLIEFLAGAGLAIFFHFVLHSPEVAYSIFGIGILLSLATYLIREDLEKTRNELIGQYHQAHEVTFAIARISDAECHTKAEAMLSGIKKTIVQLQQGFIPLDETEFYLEGAKCSDLAVRRMKSVDPISNGWHTRGALVNYYQSNLRALERGVAITRIFVMNHEEFADSDAQKVLLTQLHDGIEVRIIFRDELPAISNMSGRDINSSFDFAIYDDQVVTEVFQQSGTYFGRKTCHAVNVEKFIKFYELIEHSSNVLAVEDDRIILASTSPVK